MKVITVSAQIFLVVAASGLAISLEDKNEATTTTEAPTNLENILTNTLEAARKSESKRFTENYGRRVIEQVKGLKKLCKPRLVPLSVREVLGPKSYLLDFNLFPQVVGVKRCNTACSYCGGGLDLYGPHRKVCTSTATRNKTFIIQVSNGTSTYYEKLQAPVDRKCACRNPRHAAVTVPSGPV